MIVNVNTLSIEKLAVSNEGKQKQSEQLRKEIQNDIDNFGRPYDFAEALENSLAEILRLPRSGKNVITVCFDPRWYRIVDSENSHKAILGVISIDDQEATEFEELVDSIDQIDDARSLPTTPSFDESSVSLRGYTTIIILWCNNTHPIKTVYYLPNEEHLNDVCTSSSREPAYKIFHHSTLLPITQWLL